MSLTTQALYNTASDNWARNMPILLSDYTARPFLLEWCQPVENNKVLDLGCGEGYFSRNLKKLGAGEVYGVDISEEMIRHAAFEENNNPLGIHYSTGHACDLSQFDNESFDLVVAVFLFNYLSKSESKKAMSEIHRVLRTDGRFIFSSPHPSLPFLRPEEEPFYFSKGGFGYFSGRDKQFEGEIWRRDGNSVPVRCIHKTLEDYFDCIGSSGFNKLPEIKELHADNEIISLDPDFFTPLKDQPLHIAIKMEK